MRKLFLSFVVSCLFTALSAQAETGFDSDITNWSYVENGTIYSTVIIENPVGVVITVPGSETEIELTEGSNTLKVPLSQPVYEVSAKDGYAITVKVGDKAYVYDNEPIVINCTKPAPVYISATGNTSTNCLTISANDAEVKYYDLNGLTVKQPQPGKIYIRVSGSEVRKVKF
ncbi:MAG: hypothetical protein K2M93_08510 [Muribaculaceae bacterium]|nr:hypothetical protein [Muribaculaceae bacterium]